MDFRLLGPVELWVDGQPVELGHARQRCVLAVLLYDAGRPVPVATLIDRVWDHEPPDTGLNALYAYVARLRKVLAPYGIRLLRRSGGYLLDIDPETVDLYRFSRLLEAGRRDEALALWRGTPFAGLSSGWLDQARAVLRERRLCALVAGTEVALRAGRAAELVAPLRELVAEYPNDERPVRQLVRALHRSGRRVTLYRQALVIAREIGDPRLEASALAGLAHASRTA